MKTEKERKLKGSLEILKGGGDMSSRLDMVVVFEEQLWVINVIFVFLLSSNILQFKYTFLCLIIHLYKFVIAWNPIDLTCVAVLGYHLHN